MSRIVQSVVHSRRPKDQNRRLDHFHRRNKPARFHQRNTDSRSYLNNTDCLLRPYNSRIRNFRRRHSRKVPDLPEDNHNTPDPLRILRYLDSYKLPIVDRLQNNLFLHWRHRHNHIPNCRPDHNRLRQRPVAIKKSLRPDWHSNRTSPFWAIRAFSFSVGLVVPPFLYRPLHIPTYKAYHNIREQAVEWEATLPFRLVEPTYE